MARRRRICRPQTCPSTGRQRLDLKGIAASKDQPPSKRPVFTVHTGFQSPLKLPSFVA